MPNKTGNHDGSDVPPFDVIVVGGGAAGSSAAIVLGRARRSVLLCDIGSPRNGPAPAMHGFISRDGCPPRELLAIARQELEQFASVRVTSEAVTEVDLVDGLLRVSVASGATHRARRLLLATGVADDLPDIDGLNEHWGTSAFVCPYCDGWEFRDRPIVICGSPGNLVGMAQELYQWSRKITICGYDEHLASASERKWLRAAGVPARANAAARIAGKRGSLVHVELEGGEDIACDAVFVCATLRQRTELVALLGCRLTKDGMIHVDDEHRTSVAECYAAGDVMTKTHQVVVASASGVKAAIAINTDLTQEDVRALVANS